MLTACLDDLKIEATTADRGPHYHCPGCRNEVILKRGRIKIAHFAHKPPVECDWAKGETIEHMQAKLAFCNALSRHYSHVEVEKVIPALPQDRRADVFLLNGQNEKCVIEIQHTAISLDDIERRSATYARENIAQLWVVLISPKKLMAGEQRDRGICIEKYPARPFERWISGLQYGNMLYFDGERLWKGRLLKNLIDVPESIWYDEYGQEETRGGYTKISKRWKNLVLTGSINMNGLRFNLKSRQQTSLDKYKWPKAKVLNIGN
jgi:competence protein CoiA